MSAAYRRFEVLLPLRFNDGAPVPEGAVADTLIELRERFGAVSSETQVIQGQWSFQGEVYRDELVRLLVDCADTVENRQFFTDWKPLLKARFQQLDIWVTSHSVDVI